MRPETITLELFRHELLAWHQPGPLKEGDLSSTQEYTRRSQKTDQAMEAFDLHSRLFQGDFERQQQITFKALTQKITSQDELKYLPTTQPTPGITWYGVDPAKKC